MSLTAIFTLGALLAWLLVGIFASRRGTTGFALIARSLAVQLVAGFLASVAPILLLTVGLLEKMGSEHDIRLDIASRLALEHRLRAVDESSRLFTTWLPQVTRHAARQLDHRLAALAPDAGPDATQHAIERELGRLQHALFHRGAPVKAINFMDPADRHLAFPSRDAPRDHAMMRRSLGHGVRRNVSRLGGRGFLSRDPVVDRAGDLLFGSEIDNLRTMISQTVGESAYVRMTMDRDYSGAMQFGTKNNDHHLFHHLTTPDRRMAVVQFSYQYDLRSHLRHSWRQALAELPGREPRLAFSETDLPGFILLPDGERFPPDAGFTTNTSQDDVHRCLAPAAVAWLNTRAAYANQPVWEFAGGDRPHVLRMSYPSRQGNNQLLVGEIDLGPPRIDSGHAIQRQEWLLLGVLLLALIASLTATRAFLEPLETLQDRAARIGAGDFSARFPAGYRDEFAVLADAFDRMAEAGEQGRLLGRFVSADVRAVARNPASTGRGGAAERREVVLLFSGLGGFADRLRTEDPRRLVGQLNRYLEAMARLVRAHGGEIDKFIGDKLLAVFRPAAGDDALTALPGPVVCARAMRAAVRDGDLAPECRLGIGLVAGPVLAGILGSAAVRQEFTVIGDPVNLASRLGDLAAHLPTGGIAIDGILAAAVRANADRWGLPLPCRSEIRTVKGKTREVEIHLLAE